MALPTQTVDGINTLVISQLEASLGQTIPILPKAALRVLAKVIAGVFILLYKYCGFIFLQLFVAYASDQPTTVNGTILSPLIEWGRLIGVGDPQPATQAQLSVSVLVQNQTGSLPAFSSLLRSSTGVIYQTVAAVPLNAPTVTVTVRATSDQKGGDGSGSLGNLNAGDVLDFSSPLPSIGSKATVLAQLVTGADAEATETYRARVISRFQSQPQGGAYADYREWAENVLGIINVYPYAGQPGEVNVYCEADTVSSGSPDGIPTLAQLTAVAASIELDVGGVASRRPVNAAVNVLPITRTAFDVQVLSLIPSTSALTDSIKAAVDEYCRTLEPYIVGLSVLPRKDRITQAAIASVVNDVASSAGSTVSSVILLEGGAPVTSRSLAAGEKAKANAPTYP